MCCSYGLCDQSRSSVGRRASLRIRPQHGRWIGVCGVVRGGSRALVTQIVTHLRRNRDASVLVTREEIIRLLSNIQAEAYVDDDSEDRQAKLSRIYTMAGDAVGRMRREEKQ